jgi:hypothetical protein
MGKLIGFLFDLFLVVMLLCIPVLTAVITAEIVIRILNAPK